MRQLLAVCLLVSGSAALQAWDWTVLAAPTTVERGHYAANAKPEVTIRSGDAVTLQTVLAYRRRLSTPCAR
jgi:hypothetical protein